MVTGRVNHGHMCVKYFTGVLLASLHTDVAIAIEILSHFTHVQYKRDVEFVVYF